jgi:tetratricopeptide (TPR) repeat protein
MVFEGLCTDVPSAKSAETTEGAKPKSFRTGTGGFVKSTTFSILLAICSLLSACTTMQAGSAFQAGRRALIGGDDEAALGFFQTVAESNPNFVFTTGSSPRQSIWSFVGRTEYLTDQFSQARQSLERAISGDREENIARLYLGLTLIQLGDRQGGLKEIEIGLRGINDFLNNIARTQGFNIGQFWDPNRDIRNAIQYNLQMIASENLNWQQLTANIERIALQMERETDLARRQESRERRSMDRGRP